ncbi:hypothetical protein C0993_006845 [Termitomyces sp. T159_Od127]|nr:hypothetical protein C0993_006845 [Termitomyces sp. T159_Od127]
MLRVLLVLCDILRLAPKQPSYDGYKALVTQINQRYWKDYSEYLPPLEQGPANVNQPPGPCPQTQLNAADTQEALDPNQADSDLPTDPHNTSDYANNKEALHVSRFRNWLWIDVLEETQEKQQREGACILCGEQGHFINECPKRQVLPCFEFEQVSAADHPHTLLQLHLKSAQSFVLNTQLSKSPQVFTALINSKATGTFVSDQLDLTHDSLDRPIELQLFDGKPTTAGPITKSHTSSITLDNGLQFLVHLLVTQLPKYKGPNYPTPCSWTTSDSDDMDQLSKPIDPNALDIKIISLAPFAHIIQDGTPSSTSSWRSQKNT